MLLFRFSLPKLLYGIKMGKSWTVTSQHCTAARLVWFFIFGMLQNKSETHFLMDGPKFNIFRHSSIYLWESESYAFMKSVSMIKDSIFLQLTYEVQNVDNIWSNYIAGHIGLLLLPYYSTYQRPKPLSDTAWGKLVMDWNWPVVSRACRIFLFFPEQTDNACS